MHKKKYNANYCKKNIIPSTLHQYKITTIKIQYKIT